MSAPRRSITNQGECMLVKTIIYPELAIQSYIVADEKTKQCAVIDAPRLISPICEYIRSQGLTIEAILETHVHADFISGSLELKKAFSDVPKIYCSAAAGPEWLPRYVDKPINDGDAIEFGSIILKAVHTPGHTPEHISWLCYNTGSDVPILAFTGDFLFVQGVGRPDLLGEDLKKQLLKELHNSIFNRFGSFPDSLTILPSHGAGSMCGKAIGAKPSSTLGEERRLNSAFVKKEEAAWMFDIEKDMPQPPKLFSRNKKINISGAPLLHSLESAKILLSREDVVKEAENRSVLDFRDPQTFALSHFRRAVNVPLTPSTANWLAGVLPQDEPLLCVLSNKKDKERIEGMIRMLGHDQPISFFVWDENILQTTDTEKLNNVNVPELKQLLAAPDDIFIVDVRTPAEWNSSHMSAAHHIEINAVERSITQIPTDKHIIVVCGSGWRSSIAASLLKKNGFSKVSHIKGGMQAVHESSEGIPLHHM